MEIEVIKKVIQAFNQAGLNELSLKTGELELKLKKEIVDGCRSESRKEQEEFSKSDVCERLVIGDTKKLNINQKVIKSPIVGTFYQADAPNHKPFVEVGSYVHKGDIVCIVEAMKLMNEVEAEEEGEVVEILVNDEEMVEYNQPLILLK